MKTKMFRIISVVLILLLAGSIKVFSQKVNPQNKIKTLVVYDEKFNKEVSKKIKESETIYDSKGNVTEEILYTEGKADTHIVYQYDSENNKIKETESDASGNVLKISEYKIEKGLRTEKSVYNAKMKIKSKKTYVYTFY